MRRMLTDKLTKSIKEVVNAYNEGEFSAVTANPATTTETLTGIEIDGTGYAVGGGTEYTAGTGIDITNDEISVDNTVALKTDIPSNYVTTDTAQTITGQKTFITDTAAPLTFKGTSGGQGVIMLVDENNRFGGIITGGDGNITIQPSHISQFEIADGPRDRKFHLPSKSAGTYTLATEDELPAAVSGTNDGTNWTSLTVGSDTYAIPSGGSGSSYTFTNGLTENSGTVTNDLFTKITTTLDGNPSSMYFELNYSHIAMGQNALSRGTESVAIGSSAQGYTQGIAIGSGPAANNYKSIAIGYQAKTSLTRTGQTVLGNKNAVDNDSSFIFADGANNPTNPNLAVIKTDGTIVSKNLPAVNTATAGTYNLQATVDSQGNVTYA